MTQKPRRICRKWIGMILSLCIILSTIPATVFAENPEDTKPFYGIYEAGTIDNSHDSTNPLGDLVMPANDKLPENYDLPPEGVYEYAALYLEFQYAPSEENTDETDNNESSDEDNKESDNDSENFDGDKRGKVTIQTGNLTTESTSYEKRIFYGEEPDDYYDISCGGYGAAIKMNNDSDLILNTGSITAEGQALSIETNENAHLKMNVDGTINGSGGIGINATDSIEIVNSKDVITEGSGVGVEAYNSNITVNVTGDIDAGNVNGGDGISVQSDRKSEVNVTVTGSVVTKDGRGLDLLTGSVSQNSGPNTINVSVGGFLQANGDYAINVLNNDGDTDIKIGTDREIENAGNITAENGTGVFIETLAHSTINFSAGDVEASGTYGVRPDAEGDGAIINVNVGNVTNYSGDSIQASAWAEGSNIEINADNIVADKIGLHLDTDRWSYGNTEDGSIYGSGGIINAAVGTVTGAEGGIYADLDDGFINVTSGAVTSGYNGINVKTSGFDAECGVTITVDGEVSPDTPGISVKAAVTGISVSSIGKIRKVQYEGGREKEILVFEDDTHENWWEKTRRDENGPFIWVSSGEGDNIQWTKYRSSSNDNEYEDYSQEDLDLPIFWDFYDGSGWFVPYEFSTDPENNVNISTGGVQAGQYGVKTGNNGGKFDINVNGDVSVDWDDPESWEVSGIYAENYSGTTNISIDGNMSVASTFTGDGITLKNYDGKVNIDVAGNAEAADGTAVTIQSDDWDRVNNNYRMLNGDALLNIGGDVNAKNGIDVDVNEAGTGTVQINIAGSLYTAGNGIKIGREQDNQGPAHVIGDVAPEPNNHVIGDVAPEPASGATPAVDLVVEETISGLTPILVSNIEAITNVLITTWAVIPNENSQISADQDGNAVREVEKNINYIIKKEDNKFGTLSVAGTTAKEVPNQSAGEPVAAETEGGRRRGAPAEEQEPANTKTLNVAKEKEKLTLTVSLNEEYRTGYDIVIYNGVGENKKEAEVENLENGDFCFKVPWAGGVYLTFGLMKDGQIVSEPDPDPDPDLDPDSNPEKNPEPAQGSNPEKNPEQEPEPELKPEPKSEPDSEVKQEETGTKSDSKAAEKTKSETGSKQDSATIVADNDVSDTGNGQVVAVLYGEKEDGIEEDYIIWFLSGYGYRAKFRDGYTEYGTYRVKDDELTLTARDGSERTVTDRVIAFDEERKAEIVKTDFSDSARIIGEFNVNDEDILEITDRELKALSLPAIHETIENPYAWEILTAILTEKAE